MRYTSPPEVDAYTCSPSVTKSTRHTHGLMTCAMPPPPQGRQEIKGTVTDGRISRIMCSCKFSARQMGNNRAFIRGLAYIAAILVLNTEGESEKGRSGKGRKRSVALGNYGRVRVDSPLHGYARHPLQTLKPALPTRCMKTGRAHSRLLLLGAHH